MEVCILRSEKPLANGCLLRRYDWIYPNLITDHGFPGGSEGKASACNVGDPGSIPGSGRSPGEGNGNPLQTLAWKISWRSRNLTCSLVGYSPWGRKGVENYRAIGQQQKYFVA